MQIALQKIRPLFFNEQSVAGSQIWLQQVLFVKGQHTHIVAPSGSGKTSLVHFMYGVKNEYVGDIFYNNESIKNFTANQFSAWRQKHISIIFQDLRLFEEQTVLQNLEIKRLLQPYHPQNKIEAMARRLGIDSKLEKQCSTCSYGERQRIAIIRSLLQPFDFLLLDEPFSHLDETNRKKAMELMEEEAAARKASIVLADLKERSYFKAATILKM